MNLPGVAPLNPKILVHPVILVLRHEGTRDWFAFEAGHPLFAFGGDRPEVAVARLIRAASPGNRYRVIVEGMPAVDSTIVITASQSGIAWARESHRF